MSKTRTQKNVLFFFGADIDLMHLDVALKNHGLTVNVARSVDDALAYLDSHPIDLILIQDFSDKYMLTATEKLQQHLHNTRQDVPVAVVSYSAGDAEFVGKAFRIGVSKVFSRHTSLVDIVPRIDAMFED